jgi:hypothetical protein
LTKFDQEIGGRIAKIELKIKEADDSYKITAKFFCENPSDASDKFGEKVIAFKNLSIDLKILVDIVTSEERVG